MALGMTIQNLARR